MFFLPVFLCTALPSLSVLVALLSMPCGVRPVRVRKTTTDGKDKSRKEEEETRPWEVGDDEQNNVKGRGGGF